MDRTWQSLKQWWQRRLTPGRTFLRWYRRRPRLVAWACLAAGMALVVVLFGRDVGLTFQQHAILALLTIPLAWLCTWIIFLEDDDGGGSGNDRASGH